MLSQNTKYTINTVIVSKELDDLSLQISVDFFFSIYTDHFSKFYQNYIDYREIFSGFYICKQIKSDSRQSARQNAASVFV